MFQQPEILATASALARHSSQRQSLVAENIANADTPGYRSRDLDDFANRALSAMRKQFGGHDEKPVG